MMIGPELFGTTDSTLGVWEILYRMDALIKWGVNDYHSWVKRNIMRYAEETASGEQKEL